jgi:hypothetical protein
MTAWDTRTDSPVTGPLNTVAWERVERDPIVVTATESRAISPGYQAINAADGAAVFTREVPEWVGQHDGPWTSFVQPDGSIALRKD